MRQANKRMGKDDGLILTGENRTSRSKTFPITTLPTTAPTRTCLGSNPALRSERSKESGKDKKQEVKTERVSINTVIDHKAIRKFRVEERLLSLSPGQRAAY